MKRQTTLFCIVVFGICSLGLTGCKWIKEKAGITTSVSDPDKDSPEWVVYQVIKLGIDSWKGANPDEQKKNEKAAWNKYKGLLHSSENWSNAKLRNWREFRWATMRRKVYLFTKDEDTQATVKNSSPAYEIARELEDEKRKTVKLFVVNSKSEMPTPCSLQQDPKQGNQWRIINQCLN